MPCLLQDGRLVTGFSVQTRRLLNSTGPESDVKLIIQVSVIVLALTSLLIHPFVRLLTRFR